MNLLQNPYFLSVAGVLIGVCAGYWLWRWKERALLRALQVREQFLLENAKREADAITREARLRAEEESLQFRQTVEQSLATRRQELSATEKHLIDRETLITRQLEQLALSEAHLQEQEQAWENKNQVLARKQQEWEQLCREYREKLESLAQLSQSDARQHLLNELEQDVRKDATRLSRRIVEEAQSYAEEKARRILSLAIQRYAGEHVNDISSATVALPGDEMKGRIIGREGRNIRAFEAATGVTVLIDDTPNAVVVSAFDPVRRAIARESMQRLLADGRIHPTRIEEVVAKVSQEMEEAILRSGEEAVFKTGLPPLHQEIVRLLGRLRFRHSYSQNVLDHSMEVAHLAGLLAAELGLNISTAKRAGLLHDIGKAVNHEVEGAHALVGADLLRRYGESEEIINAVASHHDEIPHNGAIGILVAAADAISASRPGARSETMTAYIKRVESLERIGHSIPGVQRCFALQAGRELRVLVQPDEVSDDEAHALARQISKRIEEELQYPGQIRVTVLRETRCVEYAK
jgi:ribonuclease Y